MYEYETSSNEEAVRLYLEDKWEENFGKPYQMSDLDKHLNNVNFDFWIEVGVLTELFGIISVI